MQKSSFGTFNVSIVLQLHLMVTQNNFGDFFMFSGFATSFGRVESQQMNLDGTKSQYTYQVKLWIE